MKKLTYAVTIEHCLQHRNHPKPKDCAVCRETIIANKDTEQRAADRHTRKRARAAEPQKPQRKRPAKRTRRPRQSAEAAATS